MITGRRRASSEAVQRHTADTELAGRFGDLLAAARQAEDAFQQAAAHSGPLAQQRRLGLALDEALTEVMRAAYAAQRAEIGPLGYDDWIYRRKAKAKSGVRAWSAEADRLLTLRETHRLSGIAPLPPEPAGTPDRHYLTGTT
jgi:hypothetical protein